MPRDSCGKDSIDKWADSAGALHQYNPRCRVPDGRKLTRAKAMLEEVWPLASIDQVATNTEQEGDVKRASSSFSDSMPLLDLII